MSWDDDDFGHEFAKFKRANNFDYVDAYDGNVDVLYCEVLYKTINDYTSQWNKARKKVQINYIVRADGTPYSSDFVERNGVFWLDMGARLFNCVKEAYSKKWKYIKILKISNPNDKFDVQYYGSEYKLKVQKDLDNAIKNTAKKKAK